MFSFAWATSGAGLAIAAPTFEIRLALGCLLAFAALIYGFIFLRRFAVVQDLQTEADQTIRILPIEET
jgi:hypothetical protein